MFEAKQMPEVAFEIIVDTDCGNLGFWPRFHLFLSWLMKVTVILNYTMSVMIMIGMYDQVLLPV